MNAVAPPYTDYCEMLSQEIQGKSMDFWQATEPITSVAFILLGVSRRTRQSGLLIHFTTTYAVVAMAWYNRRIPVMAMISRVGSSTSIQK